MRSTMNRAIQFRLNVACIGALLFCGMIAMASAEAPRVLEPGKLPEDARLGPARTCNDKYHPWTPPATLDAWEAMKPSIRERMLVGLGLWPMPPAAPLAPVIHG